MRQQTPAFPYFGRFAERIVDNGYSVVAVKPGTKEPRYPHWTTACFKNTELAWASKHASKFPTDSIGIACGTKVIAIDIDEDAAESADRLHEIALEELGQTSLVRIGRWPRRTLVYRALEQMDTARLGKVEVLACGSKFVAFGIHPTTGKPYSWPQDNPTDTDLSSLPGVDRRSVERFLRRVRETLFIPAAANDNARSKVRKAGLPAGKRSNLESQIVRNEDGLVVDGREKFMTLIAYGEWKKGSASVEDLTSRIWQRFREGADLTGPKGNSRRSRYSIRDARSKAKQLARNAPPLSRKPSVRGQHPARHLHSFRRPDYWTAERKRLHQTEAALRGLAPARLVVNRAMLDAVMPETGQCAATAETLATATGLSISTVKASRRDLVSAGLWIAERGVYVPFAMDAPANDNLETPDAA